MGMLEGILCVGHDDRTIATASSPLANSFFSIIGTV